MPLNFIAQMKASAKAKAEAEYPLVLHIPGPLNAAQYEKLKEAVKAGPPAPLTTITPFNTHPADVLKLAKQWGPHDQIKMAMELLSLAGCKPINCNVEAQSETADFNVLGGGYHSHVVNKKVTAEINFILGENAPQVAALLDQHVNGSKW